MKELSIEFSSTVEPHWLSIQSPQLGDVPADRTPDRFVSVTLDGRPFHLLELFSRGDESSCFEAATHWRQFLAVGWGHRVFLVDTTDWRSTTIELGCYFGNFVKPADFGVQPREDYLLIATCDCLLRIDQDAVIRWRSDSLAVDGVIVTDIVEGVIFGEAELDPPGGWQPFRIDAASGRILD